MASSAMFTNNSWFEVVSCSIFSSNCSATEVTRLGSGFQSTGAKTDRTVQCQIILSGGKIHYCYLYINTENVEKLCVKKIARSRKAVQNTFHTKNVTQMFSNHWPSGPMLSLSRNVRLCVCLSVWVFVCPSVRLSVHF